MFPSIMKVLQFYIQIWPPEHAPKLTKFFKQVKSSKFTSDKERNTVAVLERHLQD